MVRSPRDYAFMRSRVLLALLRGTTEERFIRLLSDVPIPVQEHRRRATLLARLKRYRPSVLVLPLVDERVRPSAPLVDLCRAALPTMHIVVVSSELSRSRHLLMTLRHDAMVLVQPTDEQLRSVVIEAAMRAHPGLPSGHELFSAVNPPFLRQLLQVAWAATEDRVGLTLVASHLGVSPRTLEREALRQKLASPREILVAARFLRAYATASVSGAVMKNLSVDLPVSDSDAYAPGVPLPPLLRAVAHRVRALGGSMS